MTTFLHWFTARNGLLRKTCVTAVWLLLSAAVLDCGSAPEAYVPLPPSRPIQMDATTYEWIGREALAQYGYEEIIRRAVDAGFLRYPDSERTNTQNLVGQTMEDAAREAGPVFTEWAVTAAITSQLDSPGPGPMDVIAIGMLVVGLVHAGVVGAIVLSTTSAVVTATPVPTATPIPTAKPTTTTTAPPIPIALPRESCLPCKTVSGRIVPVGTTSYRPLDTPSKPQHGISGPHHNLYTANQAPRNSPVPCKCFWQPIGAVSPANLPTGAIPIEPFANF